MQCTMHTDKGFTMMSFHSYHILIMQAYYYANRVHGVVVPTAPVGTEHVACGGEEKGGPQHSNDNSVTHNTHTHTYRAAIHVFDNKVEGGWQVAPGHAIDVEQHTLDKGGELHTKLHAGHIGEGCTLESTIHAGNLHSLVKGLRGAIVDLGGGGGAWHGITNPDGDQAGVAAASSGIAASQLCVRRGV